MLLSITLTHLWILHYGGCCDTTYRKWEILHRFLVILFSAVPSKNRTYDIFLQDACHSLPSDLQLMHCYKGNKTLIHMK